jgi:predicted ATP-grasp superfamily ATP-dependent carboligase
MTKRIIKYEDLEKEVYNLPSTSKVALEEVLKGMYAGKPLLGSGGLLTQLVKDLTQIALPRRNGRAPFRKYIRGRRQQKKWQS